MAVEKLGFWTPITGNTSKSSDLLGFLRPCEDYFAWGSTRATIINIQDVISVDVKSEKKTFGQCVLTAIKILLLPALGLIAFLGKCLYRLCRYYIIHHQKGPSEDTLNELRDARARETILTEENANLQLRLAELSTEVNTHADYSLRLKDQFNSLDRNYVEVSGRLSAKTIENQNLVSSNTSLETKLHHAQTKLIDQSQLIQQLERSNRLIKEQSQIIDELEEQIRAQKKVASSASTAASAAIPLLAPSPSLASFSSSGTTSPLSISSPPPKQGLDAPVVDDLTSLLAMPEETLSACIIRSNDDPVNKKFFFNKKLEAYLKTIQGVTFAEAKDHIEKGAKLYERVLSAPQEVLDEAHAMGSHAAALQITSFMWFLMAHAINKDSGFNQGAFMLTHNQATIYEFLKAYPKAYARRQSHIPGLIENPGWGYGIDCPSGPADKQHLLFEMRKDGTLFIKPEDHGAEFTFELTALVTFGMHAIGYIQSQFKQLLGMEQKQDERKERINPSWKKSFSTLVKSRLPQGESTLLIERASNEGHSLMYNTVHQNGWTGLDVDAFLKLIGPLRYAGQIGNEVDAGASLIPGNFLSIELSI